MPRLGIGSIAGAMTGRERRGFKSSYFESPDRARRKSRYKNPNDFEGRAGSADSIGSMFGGGSGAMGGLGGMMGGLGGVLSGGSGEMGGMPGGTSGSKSPTGASQDRAARTAKTAGGVGSQYAGGYGSRYGGYGGMYGGYGGMYGGYGGMYGGYGGMYGGYGGMYGGYGAMYGGYGAMYGGGYGAMYGGGFYSVLLPVTAAYITPFMGGKTNPALLANEPKDVTQNPAMSEKGGNPQQVSDGGVTEIAKSLPKEDTSAAPPAAETGLKNPGSMPEGGGGTVNTTGALAGKTKTFGGEDLQAAEELLTTNFLREARIALKKDGIDFNKAKELDTILVDLSQYSRQVGGYLAELRKDEPDPSKLPEDIGKFVSTVSARVQDAVRFTTRKKHPSLNITLLKFEAVAFQMGSLSAPKEAMPEIVQGEVSRQGAEGELLRAKDEVSDSKNEKAAKTTETSATEANKEGISDMELFDPRTMLTGSKQVLGAHFLRQIGVGDLVRKREYERGETMKVRLSNMRRTSDALKSGREKTEAYVKSFIKGRPELTTDQISKMVTLTILFGLGMEKLGLTKAKIWSFDPKDAGYQEMTERARESYTTTTEMGDMKVVIADRAAQFEVADNIEKYVREIAVGLSGSGESQQQEAG